VRESLNSSRDQDESVQDPTLEILESEIYKSETLHEPPQSQQQSFVKSGTGVSETKENEIPINFVDDQGPKGDLMESELFDQVCFDSSFQDTGDQGEHLSDNVIFSTF
jgi:hypothetical protein